MATIRKKTIGKQTYYYLEHAFREGGKVHKKEKYLGKRLLKDSEGIKKKFLAEIYEEKWHPLFDTIKKNFSKEKKLMPKYAREKETEKFMIRFTYDTQRIEGSRLTLRETANLLEKKISPNAKPIGDIKEADAHKKIFYEMLKYKKDLSLQIILYWHKNLFENTKPEIAGRIRAHQVAISGGKFIPAFPAEVYPLLKDFFKWYNKNNKMLHAVELASLAHLKFVTIHPFADGNGRISRLMINFILNKNKYPMLHIHYENRNSYYNALETSQTKGNETAFLNWFFKRYVKEYKGYLGK